MGLTCSVLGHRFGDLERVEEREEQGSEVVVTIREVKRCERCSHDSIVSESKEVTSMEPEPTTPPAEPATETPPAEQSPPEPAPAWPDDDLPGPDVEDDGVILENDPTERGHGEWPPTHDESDAEHDRDADDEYMNWPEAEGEDEGYSAASVGNAGDEESSDVSFSGLTPEVSDDGGDTGAVGGGGTSGESGAAGDTGVEVDTGVRGDADQPAATTVDDDTADAADSGVADDADAEILEPTTASERVDPSASAASTATATRDEIDAATEHEPEPVADDGFARASSIRPPVESHTDDRETEYFCPRCEFVRRSIRASVRPGDICPSCRRGYLAARELD